MSRPLTIVDAAAAVRTGETTAEKLVQSAVRAADALERAEAIDALVGVGRPVGALAGMPIGVKDVFADSYGPTTAQSLVLYPHWGATEVDATVVARLKSAGAIV